MSQIEDLYLRAKQSPSDIHEHVEFMCKLGQECAHITEFGVRFGVSTIAWAAARPKTLVCYDLVRAAEVSIIESAAEAAGVAFVFHQQDVLSAGIDQTDLLFIDTLHTYDQLRQELALHADKVRKYLVLHDTEMFGQLGELPGTVGLWPAVTEFLAARPEWTLLVRRSNNNGLTVLGRLTESHV
jgi:cephalosporin hydroxylase